MGRHARRVDGNQNEIAQALEKLGFSVEKNHDDILVGKFGFTFWYELKVPEAVSKRTGQINESAKQDSQVRLETTWKGHYKIVSSVEEILEDINQNIKTLIGDRDGF